MPIELNSQTDRANITTTVETPQYDWDQSLLSCDQPTTPDTAIMQRLGLAYDRGQLGSREPVPCVPNSPTPLSSWSGTEYQSDNTQAEEQLAQRALSILPQLMPQVNRFLSEIISAWTTPQLMPRVDRQAFPAVRNILAEFVVRGASSFPVSLVNALGDLQEVTDEACEEGLPLPSDVARQNADRLLRKMYTISPRRFEVYPTQDGEIAIDAPDGHGRSVLLLCDSEGGALCLVNMNGNHRRARYSTTDTLPDGFVREALADLERQSD